MTPSDYKRMCKIAVEKDPKLYGDYIRKNGEIIRDMGITADKIRKRAEKRKIQLFNQPKHDQN